MARMLDAAIAELAASQHSVFSLSQVFELGGTTKQIRHRVAQDRWVRVMPGVFTFGGIRLGLCGRVMAAVLWAGPGAVASHRTAAELYRIDGIRSSAPIHVTVPRGRYPTAPGIVTHRSQLWSPADYGEIDGIPVTTPTRVLIDSGLVVSKNELELGFEDCHRRGLTSETFLRRRLERVGAPLRRGSKPLVDLLLARNASWAPLESALELATWNMILASGLELPVRQYWIVVDGRRIRIDFAYPMRKLAVEADGFRWHSGRLKWGIDKRRQALLASIGWTVFPVTHDDTLNPTETMRLLARALDMAA